MAEKGLLCELAFDCIDWHAASRAMAVSSLMFHLWTAKHIHGWCAVGKCMKQWQFWDSSMCPCCQVTEESPQHVALCWDACMQEVWEEKIASFTAWLEDVQTSPDIQHCLLLTLQTRNPSHHFSDFALGMVCTAALEQDLIGWSNLLEGQISLKWCELQHQCHVGVGSMHSGDCWVQGLILNLLEISHMMWMKQNDITHEKARNGLRAAEAE